jgi:hypothetical protein
VRSAREVGDVAAVGLHGAAQEDFEFALRGLLGEGAPLWPWSSERVREKWVTEYETWRLRSLKGLEPVYSWADGVHVKAGLEKEKAGAFKWSSLP